MNFFKWLFCKHQWGPWREPIKCMTYYKFQHCEYFERACLVCERRQGRVDKWMDGQERIPGKPYMCGESGYL